MAPINTFSHSPVRASRRQHPPPVVDKPSNKSSDPLAGLVRKFDVNQTIHEAQNIAAEILTCISTNHPDTFCVDMYAKDIIGVRDTLHDHGVELGDLNRVVAQIESGPTDAKLRQAAVVLRNAADRLIAASRAPEVSTPSVFVRHESGEVTHFENGQGTIRDVYWVDVSVDESDISEPGKSLAYGEDVEFDLMRGPDGVTARNVRVVHPGFFKRLFP